MKIFRKSLLTTFFFLSITAFVYFFPYRKPASTTLTTPNDDTISNYIVEQERKVRERVEIEDVYESQCDSCDHVETKSTTDELEEAVSESVVEKQCAVEDYIGNGFEIEVRNGKIYVSVEDEKQKYYFRANAYLSNQGCKLNSPNVHWEGVN